MKKRNILSLILSILIIINSCSFAAAGPQTQVSPSEFSSRTGCSSFGPDASDSTLQSAASTIANSSSFTEGTATAELNGNYRSKTSSSAVQEAAQDDHIVKNTVKIWTEFYNAGRGSDNDGAWAAGYYLEDSGPGPDPDPDSPEDPEPSHTHSYTSTTSHTHNKPSDQGYTVNYSNNTPLTAYLSPSDSYRNPFQVTSKFSIYGDLHIKRDATQPEPVTKSKTCGGTITTVHTCSCGDSFTTTSTCDEDFTYTEYQTPTYHFEKHTIASITFKGFTANRLSANIPSAESFSREQWNVPDDFTDKTYTTLYQVTSFDPANLVKVSNGLSKGTATVKCTCGATVPLDLYFNLAPPVEITPVDPTPHKLTALTYGGGLVAIDGDTPTLTQVTANKVVDDPATVKAQASEGYTFEGWYDNEETKVSNDPEYSFKMPGADYTLIANFEENTKHRVIVRSDGNGTASVSPMTGEDVLTTDRTTYMIELIVPDGETLHFSSTPDTDPDYKYYKWEEYSGDNRIDLRKPQTFDMKITRDYDIIVSFELVNPSTPHYTLTVTHKDGGITRGGTEHAIAGKRYPIWSIPNTGYKFIRWEDPEVTDYTQDDVILMPDRDYTVTAIFGPDNANGYYLVDVYSDGNGTATTDGQTTKLENKFHITTCVEGGTSITITSNPFDKFVTEGWYEIDNEGTEIGLSDNPTYSFIVTKNIKIIVHFEPNGTITDYRELRLTHRDGGYTIGGTPYALIGDIYPIHAISYDNYKFDKWLEFNDDARPTTYEQDENITMPYLTGSYYELTAIFEEAPSEERATIEVISSGPGIVSIDEDPDPSNPKTEDKINAPIDSLHEIIAEPIPGIGEFVEWTDEEGNPIPGDPTNPRQVVPVTEDVIYIAHFDPVDPDSAYNLKVESAGNGNVYPEGTIKAVAGYTYHIIAKPAKKCSFDYWEDKATGVTKLPQKMDYLMPARNVTLIGHFAKDDSSITPTNPSKKYTLTLIPKPTSGGTPKTSDGRTTGEYLPFTDITINANTKPGYTFIGWYDESLKLISTDPNPTIKMPAKNYTLTANYKAVTSLTSEMESAFTLKSIRDIRWQKYFSPSGQGYTDRHFQIPGGTNANTVLLDYITLEDNSFTNYRRIVYGYAVETEIKTSGISKDLNPRLNISYTLTGTNVKTGAREDLNAKITNPDKNKYLKLSFAYNDQNADFLTSAKETKVSKNGVNDYPVITWSWVFYLPTNLQLSNGHFLYEDYTDITVKYNIDVMKDATTSSYNYINALNNVTDSSFAGWGGNVFTYRTRDNNGRILTVLTDLENDLTY